MTVQRQFDLTEEMIHTNQALHEPQSIMSQQALEHLCRELVRMCDSVEKHGLVDYQMGVAEEQIMDCKSCSLSTREIELTTTCSVVLLKSLSLLDPASATQDDEHQPGDTSMADP